MRPDAYSAKNDRLEARVQYLEEALGIDESAVTFPAHWMLTPTQARMLALLVKRPLASMSAINAVLYAYRDVDAEPNTCRALICKLRKKLAPYGVVIENQHGHGWLLPPASRARLAELRQLWARAVAG